MAITIPMLFVIATFSFFLISMIPGDPATSILGPDASAADLARVRAELGLDQPLGVRYVDYLFALLRGDLGSSIRTGQGVSATIAQVLPITMSIAIGGILVTLLLGLLLGLASSLSDGVPGRVAQVLAVLGLSIPGFWIGVLLVLVFSIQLAWFPAVGYTSPAESVTEWLHGLVLPVVTVALAGVATIARQTRAAMRETLSQDYVRTLLAAGTPRWMIVLKHGLRNAAIPVVTSLGFQFINLLSAAIIIEQVFALNGVGQLTVTSVNNLDIPMLQGIVILTAIIVLIVNLVIDLLYGWLNPKVRRA